MDTPRLTTLSHGGGCGCKIAPNVLSRILAGTTAGPLPPELLVGIATRDDAAVWRLNDEQALVATTDFFMPIVDDPFDFGRIAAANALSDVYAMGGAPIFALAILGMPLATLPVETIRRIAEGGAAVCAALGLPVAGGHSIDSVEPIYGLVALGLVHPERVKRNQGARPGDRLVLGKALGVGIQSAALKKGRLDAAGYAAMLGSTTKVNTVGAALGRLPGVHAMTDVTGFGLGGHLLELLEASGVGAQLDYARLPLLPGVPELLEEGLRTGASGRNLESWGGALDLDPGLQATAATLLSDPQTSGGLLVAVDPAEEAAVLAAFAAEGFDRACVIGEVQAGPARLRVR